MCMLSIPIPEEIFLSLNQTQEELECYIKTLLAMSLYQKHHISLGYAAELAGMTEEDFIFELGRAGISIFSFDSEDELSREFANA